MLNMIRGSASGLHAKFDIGESYAGLVPISPAVNETRKLFFWYTGNRIMFSMLACLSLAYRFFPSTNPAATDEVVIW